MLKSCWNDTLIFNEKEISEFKSSGKIAYDGKDLVENQGVIINNSLLGIYDSTKGVIRKLVNESFSDIQAKENNKGLKLFYDNLSNENIRVVCVNAPAGTGKTSTAMAYANQKVLLEQAYKSLTITRPNVEVGKGHGFLPGSLDEKLDPLNAAFTQWLERFNQADMERLKQQKIVNMQSIAYIRGLDIQDQIFIVDECQNLTKHEMKTILTRVGEKSKVILIGDASENQIDKKELNAENNGLVHVIKNWYGKYSWFGYVELTECLRGPVCSAAVKDL